MSFIDDVIDFGSNLLGGSNLGSQLAKTALLGLALNKITSSINSENAAANTTVAVTPEPDRGVRLQVKPDSNHKIPVVYGRAYLGGIITDARITNSNTTMTYCITIAEQTGVKLSDGLPSEISFLDIYRNDQRIVFASDGVTSQYSTDRDGNVDYNIANLIKVYCYSGNSLNQIPPEYMSLATRQAAYEIMPEWTVNHMMNDLVFAIVEVNYDRDKGITELGDFTFHLENSMTLPGDCVYDYMTNTRYGAGIADSEIYKQ